MSIHGHLAVVDRSIQADVETTDTGLHSPAAIWEQVDPEVVRVLVEHVAEPVAYAVAVTCWTVLDL